LVGIESGVVSGMLSVLLGSAFLARQFWGWPALDIVRNALLTLRSTDTGAPAPKARRRPARALALS
jgi:hypothetical protein